MTVKNINIHLILVVSISALLLLSPALSSVSADRWILLATDGDDAPGPNIKALYYKVENGILYFKVLVYGEVTSIKNLPWVSIFLDVDCDPSTGHNIDGHWLVEGNTGVGAEYFITAGWLPYLFGDEAVMIRSVGTTEWDFSHPVSPDYFNVDYSNNFFVIGFKLSKFSGLKDRARVVVFSIAHPEYWDKSEVVWDWCPDSGNVLIKIGSVFLNVSGNSSGGLVFLTLNGNSGFLRIYVFTGPGTKLSYQYKLKVLSVTETGEWMYIDILINYDISGGDNWLPAKIVVDKMNGIVYMYGPINMIGYL